jgi:hypothetical protein
MLLKWPTFLLRELPNTSAGPPVVLSNILLMESNGPRGALQLDTQCLQLGPAYCVRGAADSLEWATLLDASLLSRASKWPIFLLRKLSNTLAGSCVLLPKMLSIVLNGPSISCVRCCQSFEMGHVYRSEYNGHVIEMAHIPCEEAANTSAWPPAVLSNILLMELNGPRGALLLDAQCARLGPAYCMRKGADSLEWAALLDASLLSRALKWPIFLLRKLPNTSAGSCVLLLKTLSIVSNGPCILHKRCCRSLGMGHISVLVMALNRPSFLWIQLPNTSAGSYVLPLKMVLIVLNGPSILFVSCCQFLEMGHVYRSEYTGQSLKRPTFLLRKLLNTLTGPPIVLLNILLMELNGHRGALLLDAQCS